MQLLITIAETLKTVPPQLATTVLAMIPIGELRGALPVALTVYKLPLLQAAFWSILGNMIPVWFLLTFFEFASKIVEQHSPRGRELLEKLYERTRRKLHNQVERYGVWALILFVGVPLPVTGAWTGSLAAFVFGLPREKAFFAIFLGVLISAIIVSLLTLGVSFTVQALTGT